MYSCPYLRSHVKQQTKKTMFIGHSFLFVATRPRDVIILRGKFFIVENHYIC